MSVSAVNGDNDPARGLILIVPRRCQYMPSLGHFSTREPSTKGLAHKFFMKKISGVKTSLLSSQGELGRTKAIMATSHLRYQYAC